MVSTNLEDYKVLDVLSSTNDFTYYNVMSKTSNTRYLWQAIHYQNKNVSKEDICQQLRQTIDNRKALLHDHLLLIYDFIYTPVVKTVYIIAEYSCYGSLFRMIQNCLKNQEYIHEAFLWNVLHKIVCLVKEGICRTEDIHLYNVFIDEIGNIKIFQVDLSVTNEIEESINILPIRNLGKILYNLSTLNISTDDYDLTEIPNYYSAEFTNILEFLLNKSDIVPTIDSILCHPNVLNNLIKLEPQLIYQDLKYENLINCKQNVELLNYKQTEKELQLRYDNLQTRENALKNKELKLSAKEKYLKKRERKIALAERLVKEKTSRADLYLKVSREKRLSSNSKIQIDNASTNDYTEENNYMNIMPLKLKEMKTEKFTRTQSERRVRFKGHSPLKDIKNNCHHNNENKLLELHKEAPKQRNDSDWSSETSSDKSAPIVKPSVTTKKSFLNLVFSKKKKKLQQDLFRPASVQTYEEIDDPPIKSSTCKSLVWTQESKKQAFDLLRMINEEDSIKHTYL